MAVATQAAPKNGRKGKTKSTAPEAETRRVTIEDGSSGPLTIEIKCKDPKELRGESKRGLLLTALQSDKGITMNQACSRFEWKPRDFADALRLLARVNGVVSERKADGHWHAKKVPAVVQAEEKVEAK